MDYFAYVASPYTPLGVSNKKEKKKIREERYEKVSEFCAGCLNKGLFVYSPIVHCHELAKKFNMPTDAAYWREYNSVMLRASGGLWVYTLNGWDQSDGVQGELDIAHDNKVSVAFVDPLNPAIKYTVIHYDKNKEKEEAPEPDGETP